MLPLNFLWRRVHMWVVIAELQEALDTGTRVLGSLAVVSVGQAHNQASALQPLALSSRNELVNNALRVVGEVAELSFPNGEGTGGDQRVAKFEAEGTELG